MSLTSSEGQVGIEPTVHPSGEASKALQWLLSAGQAVKKENYRGER